MSDFVADLSNLTTNILLVVLLLTLLWCAVGYPIVYVCIQIWEHVAVWRWKRARAKP